MDSSFFKKLLLLCAGILLGRGTASWFGPRGREEPPSEIVASPVGPRGSSQLEKKPAQSFRFEKGRSVGDLTIPAQTPSTSPFGLAREARASAASADPRGFLAPFWTLLEGDDASHEILVSLLNDLGGADGLARLFAGADPAFLKKLAQGLATRPDALRRLADRILTRDGGPLDPALLFALQATAQYVESELPRERLFAVLTDVLAREQDAGPAWTGVFQLWAAENLSRMHPLEYADRIEAMALQGDPVAAWHLVNVATRLGERDGTALLERMYGRAESDLLKGQILEGMGSLRTPEAAELLWQLSEREQSPSGRSAVWRQLGRDLHNFERLAGCLEDPATLSPDREAILFALATGAGEDPRIRQAIWRLWESNPSASGSEGLIRAMALYAHDERARDFAVQGLGTAARDAWMYLAIGSIEPGKARENWAALDAAARDTRFSASLRGRAAVALARSDGNGAVSALMAGYDGLPLEERCGVVESLAEMRTPEAAEALRRISSGDLSEQVRALALSRGR